MVEGARETIAGSVPAERLPMIGSAGPTVMSAGGAKTVLKPAARSSAPEARAASTTARAPAVWSPAMAAPADMNVGNGVNG